MNCDVDQTDCDVGHFDSGNSADRGECADHGGRKPVRIAD